jgi:hypothetical protein
MHTCIYSARVRVPGYKIIRQKKPLKRCAVSTCQALPLCTRTFIKFISLSQYKKMHYNKSRISSRNVYLCIFYQRIALKNEIGANVKGASELNSTTPKHSSIPYVGICADLIW